VTDDKGNKERRRRSWAPFQPPPATVRAGEGVFSLLLRNKPELVAQRAKKSAILLLRQSHEYLLTRRGANSANSKKPSAQGTSRPPPPLLPNQPIRLSDQNHRGESAMS